MLFGLRGRPVAFFLGAIEECSRRVDTSLGSEVADRRGGEEKSHQSSVVSEAMNEYASHSLSKGRRQSGNPDVAPGIMELLPMYLEKDSVVAVGEICFDDQTPAEIGLFEQQMRTRL